MFRVLALSLLLGYFAAGPLALATGNTTAYWVYGLGRQSCESFQQAREQGGYADIAYKNWISGYLTAANRTSAISAGAAGETADLKQFADILAWLEDYCASHTQQPLFVAMEELTGNVSPSAEETE